MGDKGLVSLKTKIFFSNSFVFIIAACILSIFTTTAFTKEIMKAEKKNANREIELICNNLDTLFTSTEDYLRVLATEQQLQKEMTKYKETRYVSAIDDLRMKNSLNKTVSNFIAPNTQLAGAVVWINKKIIFSGYSIQDKDVYDIISNDYLEEVEINQKPTWSGRKLLKYLDGREISVFPVSKIVMNKETGERLGAITLFLAEKDIENIYQKYNFNNQKLYYISDIQGQIISAEDKGLLGTSLEVRFKDNSFNQLKSEGYFIDNNEYLYNMREYERFSWNVASVTDMSSFIKQRNIIILGNIFILVLIMFFVFIAAYIISHTVTKPLYLLISTMKDIRDGNMNSRAELAAQGEITLLAKEFNKLMDRLQDSMKQIYEHQRARRKKELQLLQAQIKPHFLYNTMETISSFIKLGYKDMALNTIQSLSTFYRKSLSDGKEIINIKDEIDIINNYLQIQSMRYGNYMEYTINVEKEIENEKIPKLILQPLVENAIYHGIKQDVGQGELLIKGYCKNDKIIFEIFDSGIGIHKDILWKLRTNLQGKLSTSKGDSFGLYNVNERIKLFYGEEYGLSIDSDFGIYTQVNITIPGSWGGEGGEDENTNS